MQSHELYSSNAVSLLVAPIQGRKAELDTWLEQQVASVQTDVRTYDTQFRRMQQSSRGMFLVFAAVEGIIAVVAAIALAILNYIFFIQRQEEFCTRSDSAARGLFGARSRKPGASWWRPG
jgi:ABC-type antimicrobial peptide transport system permease subunit